MLYESSSERYTAICPRISVTTKLEVDWLSNSYTLQDYRPLLVYIYIYI